MSVRFGVLLPTFDVAGTGAYPVARAALLAERLGFDSVWAGDHLIAQVPVLDSLGALCAAAAVTDRVELGLGVLLLALRHPEWAAKQLATVHALAPGRLRIGVGVGGEYEREFDAAGVDVRRRGALLDAALDALPDRLARTQPPIERATFTVGGRSDAALRRAARVGERWLAMWRSPAEIATARERLGELRPQDPPRVSLLLLATVDDDIERARTRAEALVQRQYRMPLRVVQKWAALGSVEQVADVVRQHVRAGVDEVVFMPATGDPAAEHAEQYERLAAVCAAVRVGSV